MRATREPRLCPAGTQHALFTLKEAHYNGVISIWFVY